MFASLQLSIALLFASVTRHKVAIAVTAMLMVLVVGLLLPGSAVLAGPVLGDSYCPGC